MQILAEEILSPPSVKHDHRIAGLSPISGRRFRVVSFFPLPNIDAHDHEPQHERHLSEERGEGDARDHVLAFSAAA